jgi:DNA modification methylase/DNA-directed RNA polymerase subunit RPC12/RpoP
MSSQPLSAWSTSSAVRERREALGLSQSDVALTLGVTNSLLSRIESGKRTPTEGQVEALSRILCLPTDLLTLGSGRLPPDVRAVFESHAATAVAAVRQRTEANAVAYANVPAEVPLQKSGQPPKATPIPERIDVQKNSTSYRAHSYHTKVPPDAIRPFIRAFTRPGETVLDSFCGSGMTGVAALIEGRNALLSDLSPAAVHIARNYTTYCDPKEFSVALKAVEDAVSLTMRWLYEPVGSKQTVEYTTWSDVFRCEACSRSILFWDVVQKMGGTDGDRLSCPHCGKTNRKACLEWIGEEPVQSHTSEGSNRINSHAPTRSELALIESARLAPVPYWVPSVPFGPEREMWRASHRGMGITDITGFYSRRNLHALAALRHAIVRNSSGRVREALMFAFTAAVNRASRRYQWNAKRPTNVMTGTLYISSLRYEWNVWSLFRRKANDVLRYYHEFPTTDAKAQVFQRSATDLGCLPDSAADMVFIDPPFGSNIFYADASILWDSWLGELTDEGAEIVVNKHRTPEVGGKKLDDYRDLMRRSFSEVARVLKKGGRAVLAFSNSDASVWHAIQSALGEAGFATDTVHLLNKGQPSIKGVKGVTGKERVTTLDLIICLKHRSSTVSMAVLDLPPASLIDQAIRDFILGSPPQTVRRTDEIYSFVIRRVIEAGYSVSGITMSAIADRCVSLGAMEQGGVWTLTEAPLLEHTRDFVSGYVTPSKNLPVTNGSFPVGRPIGPLRVVGGRDSTYYVAHSYHTKVPPEAIRPFIEHYTSQGDVVLDPFCGSGMTGVAAALAGRRSILNDLSPAAVHLAWNHTRPCDPQALAAAFESIRAKVAKRFGELYRTKHSDGRDGVIQWTMWSTKHRCPKCKKQFLLWDAVDREEGRVGKLLRCPNCKKSNVRSGMPALDSVPAWICYETEDGKRHEKAATRSDVAHALAWNRESIQNWYPTTAVGADREMFIRCALHLKKIGTIADFYTPRNLEALALLWEAIGAISDERLRRGLAFAFTNTAWHGTRMRRFNARGGQRPLTGTLYIPQLSSEANVLGVMSNKIAQLQRYFGTYRPLGVELPAIRLGSATDITGVKDESVDYVFTDPPFGSNIFYADCNLIWESWLGRLTDVQSEAVVNRSLGQTNGGKTLGMYAGLMSTALKEIHRVLKPGGWATIVFHNTEAAVWKAIHDAASSAGFIFHEASSLDRKQQSHKGYKGRSGNEDVAHFDVIFNLQKAPVAPNGRHAEEQMNLLGLVEIVSRDRAISDRGVQGIHAEVMRRLASNGSAVYPNYSEVRALWERVSQHRVGHALVLAGA